MEFLVLISVAIAVISVLICSLVIRRVKVQINEMLDALEDPGCEARALAVETCAADLEEVLQALSGAAVK